MNRDIICSSWSYNSGRRIASVKRPDGKYYEIEIPSKVLLDDKVLEWIRPILNKMTESYYKEKELDISLNIVRDVITYLNEFLLYGDINDSKYEIYDMTYSTGVYSIYDDIKELFDINSIKGKIINEYNQKNTNQINDVLFYPWKKTKRVKFDLNKINILEIKPNL